MFCIFCRNNDTEVIETRLSDDGTTIRRRRQCPKCGKRFTTHERAEEFPILVIKKDGRRERFDRDKLKRGLFKSSEKTTMTSEQIEKIIFDVEQDLKQKDGIEIASQVIGEIVAKRLKQVNKIAYIRFASVFKRFVDIDDSEKEVKKLV